MPNYSKFQLQPKLILLLLIITVSVKSYAQEVRKLSFDGTLCERKLTIKDLNPAMPTDWTGYTHLVMELRNSTPQRFSLWVYRAPINGYAIRSECLEKDLYPHSVF
jgi:hypothetical protein